MNQVNALPPSKPAHFYENTKWRLLSYAIWLALILLVGVIGIIGDAGSISNLFGGKILSSIMQSWLYTAMVIPPMVMLVASGHIDLSVGAVTGSVAVGTAYAMAETGAGGWVGILIALRTGFLIGILHGIFAGLGKLYLWGADKIYQNGQPKNSKNSDPCPNWRGSFLSNSKSL